MENEQLRSELKEIFKRLKTKPILFVGSGLSRRYLNLPDWQSLLTIYARKIIKDRFPYRVYERKAEKELQKLHLDSTEKLPIIASLIKIDYEDRFFGEDDFENNLKVKYENDIQKGCSPFKISLSDYFSLSNANTDAFLKEKDGFSKLVNKVSNIITTNYDTFLETQFTTYNIFIGQKDLLNKKMHRIGNIFKIHGSSVDSDSLVITKEDYDLFRENQKFLTAKLLTFFIEYPTIFIGYGINDNNIISIFKDIKACMTPESEAELSKKLLFIEYTENEEKQDIINIEIAGLRMTKVVLKDYNILYDAFNEIVEAIDVGYLKTLEDKIVQLIQTTDKKVNRVYADSLENHDFSADELAVLVGHSSSVFNYGYESINLLNICEDILFYQKNYDANGIIEKSILSQKSRFSHSKLPLYKYLSKYTGILDPFYANKIINNIDDIYNKSDRNTNLYKNPENAISSLIREDLNRSVYNVYLCLKALDINDVKAYVISIWDKRLGLKSTTYLTKIVCVIDLYENKKE